MRLLRALGVAAIALGSAGPLHGQSASDHTGHDHGTDASGGSEQRGAEQPADEHALHGPAPAPLTLPSFIPPVTDADRAAAFAQLQGHAVHDDAINYFVLFDQLEWQAGRGRDGVYWDTMGWVGKDLNRLWFRTEGESEEGRLDEAEAHLLYGRAIARWWDLVAGIRQDVRPGRAQTWAAVGLQGLAPYWFEVEATAYVGPSGRTHLRLETEYEFLLTNRLILQPLVEVEVYGKADPERGIGAGLSSADVGLRLRYEFRRQFAPYVGVVWNRQFFGTAEYAEAAGEKTSGARLAVGVRLWL